MDSAALTEADLSVVALIAIVETLACREVEGDLR